MRGVVGVVAVVVLWSIVAVAVGSPWDELVFPEDNHEASRMLLVLENGTVTAYIHARDTFDWDPVRGVWVRVPWEGNAEVLGGERVFNGLIQSSTGMGESALQCAKCGLYWASDQTGWEIDSPTWHWHDSQYWYRYRLHEDYITLWNPATQQEESYLRRYIFFELHGIPYTGLIHGQFLLLYKNADGSLDHVWFNPGFLVTEDLEKYWVWDGLEPPGRIVRGKFDEEGNFIALPLVP